MSKSNFCSFQTKRALPVVRDVWSKMRRLVLEILKGYKDICLCGDGRNDSAGYSARYCVFTLINKILSDFLGIHHIIDCLLHQGTYHIVGKCLGEALLIFMAF